MKKLVLFLSISVLTGALAGCGGGSSSAPSGSVSGVDTPKAISVVTAN